MTTDLESYDICPQCGYSLAPGLTYCPQCKSSIIPLEYIIDSPFHSNIQDFEDMKFRLIRLSSINRILKRKRRRRKLIKGFLLSFAVIFMVGSGVLWILSILNIVPGYWAAIFGVVFAVLGVLFSFFQWILPQVAESSSSH